MGEIYYSVVKNFQIIPFSNFTVSAVERAGEKNLFLSNGLIFSIC
jgi:hypothetical protein